MKGQDFHIIMFSVVIGQKQRNKGVAHFNTHDFLPSFNGDVANFKNFTSPILCLQCLKCPAYSTRLSDRLKLREKKYPWIGVIQEVSTSGSYTNTCKLASSSSSCSFPVPHGSVVSAISTHGTGIQVGSADSGLVQLLMG